MINGITQSGRYTVVSGGQAGSLYMNSYAGQSMVGQMRFNTSSQNIEVYDGNNWQMMPSGYATVGLTGEAESLLDWARDKRAEEMQWKAMAQQHPAVAEAIEALRLAEERVKIIATLCKEDHVTP
jgi:hypothetical protein